MLASIGTWLDGLFGLSIRAEELGFGQMTQLRRLLHVLLSQLANILAGKGTLAGQQLLVDHRQAVLVAVRADIAGERLRRRVQRRDSAEDAGRARPFQVLDLPASRCCFKS